MADKLIPVPEEHLKPKKRKPGRPKGSRNKSLLEKEKEKRKPNGLPLTVIAKRQICRLHLMGYSMEDIAKKVVTGRDQVSKTIKTELTMMEDVAQALDFDLHKQITHAFGSYHNSMNNIIYKGLDMMSQTMDIIYKKVDEGKKLNREDYSWIIRAVEKVLPMMERLASLEEKQINNRKTIELKSKEIDLKYDPTNSNNESAELIVQGITQFIKNAKGEVVEGEVIEDEGSE